ncbi:hypothetical protein KR054_002927 [Drosophila jambulina]|nr:hypothetical protein KR054_002927 [Drosophila jambulina]
MFPLSHMKKLLSVDTAHLQDLLESLGVHHRVARSSDFLGSMLKVKPGGADPDDFEKSIAQALVELDANSDLKLYLRDLHITRARSKKSVIIYVPIPQQKVFQKIQIILVRELEKFSGKHVVVIGERKILPKPTRKVRNPLKQKRPRSLALRIWTSPSKSLGSPSASS